MSRSSFNNGIGGNVAGTSFVEQLIYWTIAAYFYNQYEVLLHYKLNGLEFDIAIHELNTVIECQSALHISQKHQKNDKLKQNYCKANNIRLIQIMNYDKTSDKVNVNYQSNYITVGCNTNANREPVDKVLAPNGLLDFQKVKNQGNTHCRHIFAIYMLISLIEGKPADVNKFCSLPWKLIWNKTQSESINKELPFENSLASKDNLVKEYRGLVKYGYISPREISIGSYESANWECSTCGHKWEARIKDRVLKNEGCSKCGYIKSSIAQSTCKEIQKSFFAKYKSLVAFIKANSMQEKEDAAKKLYASSTKYITLICPHCLTERILKPVNLKGNTNIKCKKCHRWFIE